MKVWGVCLLCIMTGLAACAPRPQPADVVFLGGTIYPLIGEPPLVAADEVHVEALAVRAGRIIDLGSREAIQRYVGDGTVVHDLSGWVAVPGLVDAHAHVQSLGRWLRQVDLVGTASYEEVIAAVQRAAQSTPPGEWVQGRGWDQNDWPIQAFPDEAALSRAVPAHPVYLRRIDGHAALVNALALQRAGIDASTPDPSGGRIIRRPDGSPTGVLVDAATDLVSARIPAPSRQEHMLRLKRALQHAAEKGLTGIHDAGIDAEDHEDYLQLLATGALTLRIDAMLGAMPGGDVRANSLLDAALRAGPRRFDPTGHFAEQTVKLMADGALGSRGAALLEPYTDEPETRGLPQYDLEAFLRLARPIHAAGFQIATHAIGDAANRMVLDAYEILLQETPRTDARHRIEHAQVLSPADLPRFAALGVLPSMQPTHCTSDMPWAGKRLGPERERGAYAWRSLRQTGVVIPGGSDAPVESIDPLLGIYAAVTRQDAAGEPAGGWHAEQCLRRSEALRAFTSWAAVASFTEDDLGTLEKGKWADLSVFDRDIVQVPAAELLQARAMLTVVGGEVVFQRTP